jgi:hypothetical protein
MSLGILGEYTKIFFASSPRTHRFSLRILGILLNILYFFAFLAILCTEITQICHILHICLNTFRILSNMLRYFQRILYKCLNTFRIFSEYAERMKNTHKDIFTFNNALGL